MVPHGASDLRKRDASLHRRKKFGRANTERNSNSIQRHVVQLGAKLFATGRDSSVSKLWFETGTAATRVGGGGAVRTNHALYQNGIGAIAKAPRIIAVLTTCHLYNTSTPVGGHAGCCGAAFPAACA